MDSGEPRAKMAKMAQAGTGNEFMEELNDRYGETYEWVSNLLGWFQGLDGEQSFKRKELPDVHEVLTNFDWERFDRQYWEHNDYDAGFYCCVELPEIVQSLLNGSIYLERDDDERYLVEGSGLSEVQLVFLYVLSEVWDELYDETKKNLWLCVPDRSDRANFAYLLNHYCGDNVVVYSVRQKDDEVFLELGDDNAECFTFEKM